VAAKTNSELIQDLAADMRQFGERLSVHANVADLEIKRHETELSILSQECKRISSELQVLQIRISSQEERNLQFERFNPERVAFLEQRATHLEKLLDEGRTRRWQVWLAVLGAILSASIALIVALVKK
jgi:hypothetical protein